MLFTHRGFDDEQRAALSALLGGSRAGFHAETKTNETRSRRIVHTENTSRLLTAPKQYSVTFTGWAGVCRHLLIAVSLALRILGDFIVNVFGLFCTFRFYAGCIYDLVCDSSGPGPVCTLYLQPAGQSPSALI